ncbi:MAG: ACT domain-containing protein [Solirubrobacterales bacterium]
MKDLTVVLEDRAGELGKLGEATGAAGINIEGMGGDAREGRGVLHVLVEDTQAAREALSGAGIEVEDERDALVVEVEDRPGTMGELARKLAGAGINIDFAYATFGGCKVVLGVADLEGAQAALR